MGGATAAALVLGGLVGAVLDTSRGSTLAASARVALAVRALWRALEVNPAFSVRWAPVARAALRS